MDEVEKVAHPSLDEEDEESLDLPLSLFRVMSRDSQQSAQPEDANTDFIDLVDDDGTGKEVPSAQRSRTMREKQEESMRRMQSMFGGTMFMRNAPCPNRETAHPAGPSAPATAAENSPEQRGESADSVKRRSVPGLPRGRPGGEIYKYMEAVPGEKSSYRCVRCRQGVGSRNSTRFLKHAMECPLIETPAKLRLSRSSKSKQISEPKSRSELGIALERARSTNSMVEEKSPAPDTAVTASQRTHSKDSGSARGRRRSSNSQSSQLSKRRKEDPKSRILTCSPAYVNEVIEAAMEYLIACATPFSIFDRKDGDDSPFIRMIRKIHPDLVKHLPGSQLLSGKYLDKYYADMLKDVRRTVRSCLENGYATVIFDGWDDVNSCSVVNILLKMEPSFRFGGRVFFLRTIYTGSKKIGASEYVKIIEDVMGEYGGMKRVCAITSDNASSCLNARDEITKKYAGIVGVNDQSHVADLLIEDVCRLPWINKYVKTVANIGTAVHNHRKLKERYRVLMSKYNETLKKYPEFLSQTQRCNERRIALKRALGVSSDRDPRIVFEGFDDITIRTAVMLAQMSNTRFASAEGVLDSFLRSITVLHTLVSERDFYTELYKPKNQETKDAIILEVVSPVEDLQFEIATLYPATKELEHRIDGLPLSEFLTAERKAELLVVFKLRKDGPIGRKIRVRLLEDIHYAAYLLDPNQAPRQPGSLKSHFHAHAERYAAACGITTTSSWIHNLMFKYACQVDNWYAARDGVEGKKSIKMYEGNPLIWWNFAGVVDKTLAEFASRTLSSSPTSCAVERSFSAQKRLHPKERNRLSRDKIQKLLFCQWNLRLKRELDSFDKSTFSQSISEADKILGMTTNTEVEEIHGLTLDEQDESDGDNAEPSGATGQVENTSDICKVNLSEAFEEEDDC